MPHFETDIQASLYLNVKDWILAGLPLGHMATIVVDDAIADRDHPVLHLLREDQLCGLVGVRATAGGASGTEFTVMASAGRPSGQPDNHRMLLEFNASSGVGAFALTPEGVLVFRAGMPGSACTRSSVLEMITVTVAGSMLGDRTRAKPE